MDYITENYDSSLTFFKGFEKSLNTVKEVYIGYKLHYLFYARLALVGIFLGIKLISLLIKAVQCYPLVTNYMADWSEFCQQCQNLRNEGMGAFERALPLVPVFNREGFLKSDPIRPQNCQFFVQFFIGYRIRILNDF